mmetsp:Transcript_10564/g.31888  ORF Transcript_10564/g.31888 Transcript_10564/m.31888 type:complete len:264 (+) Transcript_10564:224-1015(+)
MTYQQRLPTKTQGMACRDALVGEAFFLPQQRSLTSLPSTLAPARTRLTINMHMHKLRLQAAVCTQRGARGKKGKTGRCLPQPSELPRRGAAPSRHRAIAPTISLGHGALVAALGFLLLAALLLAHAPVRDLQQREWRAPALGFLATLTHVLGVEGMHAKRVRQRRMVHGLIHCIGNAVELAVVEDGIVRHDDHDAAAGETPVANGIRAGQLRILGDSADRVPDVPVHALRRARVAHDKIRRCLKKPHGSGVPGLVLVQRRVDL